MGTHNGAEWDGGTGNRSLNEQPGRGPRHLGNGIEDAFLFFDLFIPCQFIEIRIDQVFRQVL